MAISEPCLTYLSGSPVKEPYLKVPFMESLAERCSIPRALLHSSFKVPGIWASPPTPDSRFPSVVKGPLWRETPVCRAFLHISTRVPSEGAPPHPFHGASSERERHSIPRAPFIHQSKSMVDEPSSRFPKWGPYGKSCLSPEPFLRILKGPQQGPSLQVPFRACTERNATPPEPLLTMYQSPW